MMTTREASVDIVDQDQIVQNVQSDLWTTLTIFSFLIITKSLLYLAMEVYFKPMKNCDYSFVKKLSNQVFFQDKRSDFTIPSHFNSRVIVYKTRGA